MAGRRTSPVIACAVAVLVLAVAVAIERTGRLDDNPVPLLAVSSAVFAAVAAATLALTRGSRWGGPGWLALFTVALYLVSALLHNLLSGLFGIEEAFFFLVAVWVSPGVLFASLWRLVRKR